jgi:hypothetical protein
VLNKFEIKPSDEIDDEAKRRTLARQRANLNKKRSQNQESDV